MTVWMKRWRWVPLSTIKLSWSVKMGSAQEEEFANRCFGWDINCCKPYEEVTALFVLNSISIFICIYYLVLNSPRAIDKSGWKASFHVAYFKTLKGSN